MKKRCFEVNLRFNYRHTESGEWTSNLVGPIRIMAENGTEAEERVCKKAQTLLLDNPDRYWSGRSIGIIKDPVNMPREADDER